MDQCYLYNDIFLRRFVNKFYFCNWKNLPQLHNFSFEFHNTNNSMHLMMVSFLDETIGSLPLFLKKGFNYSFEGKKLFIKDLRLNSNKNMLELLKTLYLTLPRKQNRLKLVKSLNADSVVFTLLCSDFVFSFYRDLFSLLDTVNLHLHFRINNRFLFSYFFRNFNFC